MQGIPSWPEERVKKVFAKEIDVSKLSEEKREKLLQLRKDYLFAATPSLGLAVPGAVPQNKGMLNRKNDCYMICVLQCLANIGPLTRLMLRKDWVGDLNPLNKVCRGRMICAFYEVIRGQWAEGIADTLDPQAVKAAACEGSKSFANSDQQDSQEFLSFLLEALHEDINRVKIKPYFQTQTDPKSSPEQQARAAWTLHLKRENSALVEMFHGQIRSEILCPECGQTSANFEPFDMVGLSVPERDPVEADVMAYPLDPSLPLFNLHGSVPPGAKVADLFEALRRSALPSVRPYHAIPVILRDGLIIKRFDLPLTQTLSHSELSGFSVLEIFVPELFKCIFEDRVEEIEKGLTQQDSKRLRIRSIHAGQLKGVEREVIVPQKLSSFDLYLLCYSLHRNMFYKGKLVDLDRKKLLGEIKEALGSRIVDPKTAGFSVWIEGKLVAELDQIKNLFEEFQNEYKPLTVKVLLSETFGLPPAIPRKKLILPPVPGSQVVSLDECMAHSFQQEILDDENVWFCPRCERPQKAQKKTLISRAPQILIIYLKRFRLKDQGLQKSYLKVDFPFFDLDIAPFMLVPPPQGLRYNLIGVTNHSGGLTNGHCTAYSRNPLDKTWYFYDDDKVTEVRSQSSIVTHKAYIFFYMLNSSP